MIASFGFFSLVVFTSVSQADINLSEAIFNIDDGDEWEVQCIWNYPSGQCSNGAYYKMRIDWPADGPITVLNQQQNNTDCPASPCPIPSSNCSFNNINGNWKLKVDWSCDNVSPPDPKWDQTCEKYWFKPCNDIGSVCSGIWQRIGDPGADGIYGTDDDDIICEGDYIIDSDCNTSIFLVGDVVKFESKLTNAPKLKKGTAWLGQLNPLDVGCWKGKWLQSWP